MEYINLIYNTYPSHKATPYFKQSFIAVTMITIEAITGQILDNIGNLPGYSNNTDDFLTHKFMLTGAPMSQMDDYRKANSSVSQVKSILSYLTNSKFEYKLFIYGWDIIEYYFELYINEWNPEGYFCLDYSNFKAIRTGIGYSIYNTVADDSKKVANAVVNLGKKVTNIVSPIKFK